MIRNLIARFEKTGSVGDLPGRGSKRIVTGWKLYGRVALRIHLPLPVVKTSLDSETGFKNISIQDPIGPNLLPKIRSSAYNTQFDFNT